MKILIIHFKFYNEGGPEKYLFNIGGFFKSKGHEVIDFSINLDKNEYSEYEKYFPTLKSGSSEFHLNKLNLTIFQKFTVFKNQVYNFQVKKALNKLINDTNPDIAYVLSFKGKLSSSVFDICNKNKIPIVHRISDFSLLCLKNIYYRKGSVCRKCDVNMLNGVLYKCDGNSYLRSLASYLSLQLFYAFNKQKTIDSIVCPSLSTVNLFKENKRFKNNRVVLLPTYIKSEKRLKFNKLDIEKRFNNRCFAFWGRVDDDKGVEFFVKAIKILQKSDFKINAKIFGLSDNDYSNYIRSFIKNNNLKDVEIFSFLEKDELLEKVSKCSVSVLPSVWYDNMPNSLIESQSLAIPVIASRIGCFPELINSDNGLTFEPKNPVDLALKMKEILSSQVKYEKFAANSLSWSHYYCSEERHYEIIIDEFNSLIEKNVNK